MLFKGWKIASLLVACVSASTAYAAIPYTGGVYRQNFESFQGSAASLPFTNDGSPSSTGGLQGLYLYISGNTYSTTTAATDSVAGVPDYISRNSGTTASSVNSVTYRAGVNTSAHYYYRSTTNLFDVALGFFNTDSSSRGITPPSQGYLSAGFAFSNDTGVAQGGFNFSYLPEASTATNLTNVDTVSVSYAFGATGVADADGAWTDVPAMGYSVAPTTAVVTPPTLTFINGVSWLPGQTLFVRFRDANVGGTDRLSWVDDIAFSVPEPASMAIVGTVAVLALRRRRNAQ